tara:strand:- start:1735 stop:2811 length:1077 start_codon:yes stop_codon:yes gene_type:complete
MADHWCSESGSTPFNGLTPSGSIALSSLYLPLLYGMISAGDTIYIMRNEDDSPLELYLASVPYIGSTHSTSSTSFLTITGCDSDGVVDGKRTKIKHINATAIQFGIAANAHYVRFRNLEVDCDDLCGIVIDQSSGVTAGEYPSAYNIYGTNGDECIHFEGKGARIHNCYAKDMTDYGFSLTGDGTPSISNSVAINCTDDSSKSNFYVGSSAEAAHMVNCYSEGGSGYGVELDCDDASVISCTINNAGEDGILNDHEGFIAINNIISNNGGYGIDDNGADDLNVSDFNLYYNNDSGHRDDMAKGSNDIDDLNPLFTDTANYDASVGSDSPAWRAGTNGDTIGYTRRPHGVIMGGYEHLS